MSLEIEKSSTNAMRGTPMRDGSTSADTRESANSMLSRITAGDLTFFGAFLLPREFKLTGTFTPRRKSGSLKTSRLRAGVGPRLAPKGAAELCTVNASVAALKGSLDLFALRWHPQ